MIVYEPAAAPTARAGEALVAGRRIAGRLFPYGADAGAAALLFDPVDQRFIFRKPDAPILAGPSDPAAWAQALAHVASGPVLVGPSAPAEAVRGSLRAAAEAAVESGRPVYLLDPEPDGIPEKAPGAAVALCSWRPGRAEASFPGLASARSAGLACGAVFPLLPGWTAEPEFLEALMAAAKKGGASSVTGLVPAADGEGRRGIVQARQDVEPSAGDGFFELVHHGDWFARMGERIAQARAAAARHGLADLPPRPGGRRGRDGNSAAAARLEELAVRLESDEHRAALLYAAVRWIDDSRRDLSAVAREGNFRKVFPFGPEIAGEAEAALRAVRTG
jgi:hypothetical protein